MTKFAVIIGLIFLLTHNAVSQKSRTIRKRKSKTDEGISDQSGGKLLTRIEKQRALLEEWVTSMVPEVDYNGTFQWRRTFRSKSASVYFEQYNQRFSKIALSLDAKVHFASIGACDGSSDPTIRDQYLPNAHWEGVFVEPMDHNIVDLTAFIEKSGASNRSLIIQAAATSICLQPTLEVERPLYEEKNEIIPHWLRRQIGSILPPGRSNARPDWTKETVRCVTAADIMTEWADTSSPGRTVKRKRRPHILKMDVEGHDYAVLMSFVLDTTPVTDLPLLIEFEAKSIIKQFPEVKKRLESIGYIVADFGQDGFALLRGDMVYIGGKESVNSHLTKELTVGDVIKSNLWIAPLLAPV